MITAERLGTLLTEACSAWSLDDESLARRAQLHVETVRGALRGDADVSDLSAIARALGGTLDDVLAERHFWKAPAVAFKSTPDRFDLPLVRAALLRVSRAAQDRAALIELLGLPAPARPDGAGLMPVPVIDDVTAQAEDLARQVRATLSNEAEPIASIRDAMRKLGVATFLTDFGTEQVDGMTWRDDEGRACTAANYRARKGKLTALRMTFAHELCHALFDGSKLPHFGLVESRSDHGEAHEQRANAFAAHLLAPRPALLRVLRDRGLREREKPSAVHLRTLSEHFYMGVEAMAGHLVTCRLWSKADVHWHRGIVTRDMTGEDNAELNPTPGEDLVEIERRGDILDLATLALDRGEITAGRWREILELGPLEDWQRLLDERQVARDIEQRTIV